MIPILALAVATAFHSGEAASQPPNAPVQGGQPRGSYVSHTDYPPEALRRHEQGRVGFQLTISPEGRVSACQVTQSSGSVALDRATCEIMQTRAHFSPAHDDEGNPVADTVRSAIHWVLPD